MPGEADFLFEFYSLVFSQFALGKLNVFLHAQGFPTSKVCQSQSCVMFICYF